MRFAALPPVRRSVPLRRNDSASRGSTQRFFGNRPITLYASGTAALAQALARCADRASVDAPEAILPAYGCPDLVAACAHASVFPRLVDVAASGWAYDIDGLLRSLSSRTVAIVSVNLLGIPDDTPGLTDLCRQRGIALIQDSAQFLPRQPIEWPGDYVVLSFGRGKPLNLLGGGALIGTVQGAAEPLPHRSIDSFRDQLIRSRAAAFAFNVLTRPHPYRLLSLLPGTGLGQVAYKPLRNPSPLSPSRWKQVDAAFAQYQRHRSYDRQIWAPALAKWASFGIRPLQPDGPSTEFEPLRLTLLAPDRVVRDEILERLTNAHLGASRLYGTDLAHVAGIPDEVRGQGPFPNAIVLADSLFTLPTHSLVTSSIARQATECIRDWHNSRGAD